MLDKKTTVNNPSIWRPIIEVKDTCSAFIRAIPADPAVSGFFNVAGGNYAVGQVGDLVQPKLQELTGKSIGIQVNNWSLSTT